MVGDDAHPYVVLVDRAVRLAGERGCTIEHRSDLVDLVHVLDALLEEGDAFEAHAGVDVLARQVAEDVEIGLAGARRRAGTA